MCLLGKSLNDFVTHYESLNYDAYSLMEGHRRLSRSVSGPRHIKLRFNALGRSFNLKLFPGSSSLTRDAVVMVDSRPITHHNSVIYHGVDEGDYCVRDCVGVFIYCHTIYGIVYAYHR